MRKRWKISLPLFCMLLCGAEQAAAQETWNAEQEAIQKQTKIDQLKAQMAEIQSQLDAISGAKPPQSKAIATTPPPPPPQLSPEQQLEAEGKATQQHHTFSEDEDAAPRLYNATPKAPSRALLPQHNRKHKNPPK
jgi:hypothetical protein